MLYFYWRSLTTFNKLVVRKKISVIYLRKQFVICLLFFYRIFQNSIMRSSMANNKFIIGLGTTVPSTRVLKPPGGDCSDLFGLKTRQKALLQYLQRTTGALCNSKIKNLIYDAKQQNANLGNETFNYSSAASKSIPGFCYNKVTEHLQQLNTAYNIHPADSSKDVKETENEIKQERKKTSSTELKRSEGRENLLSENVFSLDEPYSKLSSEKLCLKNSPDSIKHMAKTVYSVPSLNDNGDNFDAEKKSKLSKSNDSMEHQKKYSTQISSHKASKKSPSNTFQSPFTNRIETTTYSTKNNDKSNDSNDCTQLEQCVTSILPKQLTKKPSNANQRYIPNRIECSATLSRNMRKLAEKQDHRRKKSLIIPHSEDLPAIEPSKTFIRNPITGVLTEVDSKKLFNRMRVVHSDHYRTDCYNDTDKPYNLKSSRAFENLLLSNRLSSSCIDRNPITGRGTKDDTVRCVPRGIRVTQPPGGISFGIY